MLRARGERMAKVLGVGGVFVQSADPQALREWYGRVLGFAAESWGGVIFPSLPAGGQDGVVGGTGGGQELRSVDT